MPTETKTEARATSRLAGSITYTNPQLIALVFLRILIGWHFLYEGVTKVISPNWSSASCLLESKWVFSDFFLSIVADPAALRIVDFLNEWGLIAIGAGLIAGCFTQTATITGIVLLFLYYVSTPPFVGLSYTIPAEGSYLVVNKTMIELAALVVLALFPTGKIVGLDVLISGRKKGSSLSNLN